MPQPAYDAQILRQGTHERRDESTQRQVSLRGRLSVARLAGAEVARAATAKLNQTKQKHQLESTGQGDGDKCGSVHLRQRGAMG